MKSTTAQRATRNQGKNKKISTRFTCTAKPVRVNVCDRLFEVAYGFLADRDDHRELEEC